MNITWSIPPDCAPIYRSHSHVSCAISFCQTKKELELKIRIQIFIINAWVGELTHPTISALQK